MFLCAASRTCLLAKQAQQAQQHLSRGCHGVSCDKVLALCMLIRLCCCSVSSISDNFHMSVVIGPAAMLKPCQNCCSAVCNMAINRMFSTTAVNDITGTCMEASIKKCKITYDNLKTHHAKLGMCEASLSQAD